MAQKNLKKEKLTKHLAAIRNDCIQPVWMKSPVNLAADSVNPAASVTFMAQCAACLPLADAFAELASLDFSCQEPAENLEAAVPDRAAFSTVNSSTTVPMLLATHSVFARILNPIRAPIQMP